MRNILVVDDHPLHADMALKVVSKAAPDADVRKYTDPFLALADALETPPDLIVVDFMMPKMDGLHLLRELRKKGIMTKAIIVSAFIKKVSDSLLPGNNVAAIVEKPYSTAEFMRTVEEVLERDHVSSNGSG